jgi:ketosteroid isomerase-like protein
VKADKLEWIKSGIYIGQKAEFSEVAVAFDGDTATIKFLARFTGIYDGEPYMGEPSQVTNVWVKRDGRWQMAKGG